MPAIETILIANRGEIACRIARTCRSMGIRSVAVFSDADQDSMHVSACDQAVRIGPADSRESYLDMDRIIKAAVTSGADAIHPGYGFLAENPAFARACVSAGLTFIGPPADVIDALGSKENARKLAEAAGVPVVPSYPAVAASADTMKYPVLVKASAGGGGKGMRIVRAAAELEPALESAKREAMSAFGDDTLLCERYLEKARHIEVQIFGDGHGNLVHLFERECSIQRRHQKIIEESPSPAVDEATRAAMTDAALRLARSVNYQNAGTVEMMLADDGSFYFLEVNTRLQVEHPVTEMVTGLDLVREQIRVAMGLPLSFAQSDLRMSGHAVEARLYAEDPGNGFLPSVGDIVQMRVPEGDGIRVDSGVAAGGAVSVHYDPMIAKIVAWDESRQLACQKLASALDRLTVLGVTTNRRLLGQVLRHEVFLSGMIDTHFLDHHPELLTSAMPRPEIAEESAIAAALFVGAKSPRPYPLDVPRAWGNAPRSLPAVHYCVGDQKFEIRYREIGDDVFEVSVGEGAVVSMRATRTDEAVRIEGPDGLSRRFAIGNRGLTWFVKHGDIDVQVIEQPRFPDHESAAAEGSLSAPMPGRVIQVLAEVGAACKAGQTLLILEAMKMEHRVVAPSDGTVREVLVRQGDSVDAGAPLLAIDPSESS